MTGLNLEVSTKEFEKVCRVLGDINQVCRMFCSVSELQSVSRCRVLGSLHPCGRHCSASFEASGGI